MKGILVIPFCDVGRDITDVLINEIGRIFRKDIEISRNLPIPKDAFNRKRNQYLSTRFLEEILNTSYYKDYERILGITDVDLYIPRLNFVFGEAYERSAVISLLRLRESFYKRREDKEIYHKRILTESVHELGHTYGLRHCHNPYCVMYFSNTISDTDKKGYEFCQNCRKIAGL